MEALKKDLAALSKRLEELPQARKPRRKARQQQATAEPPKTQHKERREPSRPRYRPVMASTSVDSVRGRDWGELVAEQEARSKENVRTYALNKHAPNWVPQAVTYPDVSGQGDFTVTDMGTLMKETKRVNQKTGAVFKRTQQIVSTVRLSDGTNEYVIGTEKLQRPADGGLVPLKGVEIARLRVGDKLSREQDGSWVLREVQRRMEPATKELRGHSAQVVYRHRTGWFSVYVPHNKTHYQVAGGFLNSNDLFLPPMTAGVLDYGMLQGTSKGKPKTYHALILKLETGGRSDSTKDYESDFGAGSDDD
jgi:hypothetical protein